MTKIICISDTHTYHNKVKLPTLSEEDRFDKPILIHCGDFTFRGDELEIVEFLQWIGEIENDYEKVLLIPGNHDCAGTYDRKLIWKELLETYTTNTIDLWTETYEKGQTIEVKGLTFFGFPHTPFPVTRNAFFIEHEKHDKLVSNILKADVIVSHGPCYGIQDLGGRSFEHLGSKELLNRIQELQPKLFCCGHIHEGHSEDSLKIGNTIFVNAAQCDYPNYDVTGNPVVVEI